MLLSELCVKRPVFATVLSLIVVLVGLLSYDRLSLREYPAIDEPVVTVRTNYRGASAEIVESQITRPLEESISGIEGIEVMTSISRAERSQITVRFRLQRDPDSAASDVRDRVARERSALPDEVGEPVVAKVEADAQPIMYLTFSSDRHSPLEVSDIADRIVKDRLQTLPGVAEISIFGERRYAMRIWPDRARLAAYGVTTEDIEDALRRQNVELPSGRIESERREFTVMAETNLTTPGQFGEVVLRNEGGYLVRLKDVARVELGPQDERVIARFNGQGAVALGIVKQSTANPLDVSQEVRRAIPIVQESLPPGVRMDLGYDASTFIEKSIDEVFLTIGEAILLVVAVIFLFLRSLRATLIPLVTIPVSLIGTFALMYAFGFSVNTLTLLAMVLAIGLVVDDAIVVLENIHRHIEVGLPPLRAAFRGIREIGFAVVAMTLTLAAVFAPIGFATGRTGRLFAEFALALAGAVLISGFVALTLTPMMCSRLLRVHRRHGAAYRFVERGIAGLTRGYMHALRSVVGQPIAVAIVWLMIAGSGYYIASGLKSELAPTEDRGTVVINARAPDGSTLAYTAGQMRDVEAVLASVPDAQNFFEVIGTGQTVSNARAFLRLAPWDERERSSAAIAQELRPKLDEVAGLLASPVLPPSLGQGAGSTAVQFVLLSTRSYGDMQALVQSVLAEARNNPGLINADTDLKLNQPEIRVSVDRDRAGDIGIEIDTVGRTLETMLGGREVTRFKQNAEQYDVIVRIPDVDRTNPRDLMAIFVRAGDGSMIPLSNLVRIEETVAPKELNHFNKLRSVTISANLAPGYSLGEALDYLEGVVRSLAPPDVQIDYSGQSREFRDASGGLYVIFLLALGFIFLVLAAQFESFVDPLVIMLTVPLAMTGALLALDLSGGTLNVYSQIGLVTLVGLITKHGILIVEFSNQLRDRGKAAREAVIEAAVLRLRPILMTTAAMVLGAVPLALADGAGAESRHQIGWVIVGGLLLGTLLTLFVVPTAYLTLSRHRRDFAQAETERQLAAAE